METIQKVKRKLWSAGLIAVVLAMKMSVSQAAILKGHFENGDIHAFVSAVDGSATGYGLVWNDNGGASMMSLFRIEEQDDGSEAWIKLSVNESQILGTNISAEADYTGTVIDRGSKYLSLNPTEFGKSDGSGSRLLLKESKAYEWLDLPAAATLYQSEGNSRVERRSNTISKKGVQGSFEVNQQNYNGNYVVRNPIPQVGTLHSIELSSENESGRKISRKIISFVARIKGRGLLDSSESIVFFNLSTPGKIDFNKIINP